ncbi:MAG: efflux RND transporter periplasmic adaptor subunit [Balneolaceae bacterium]|nr:efflux RND transporter periplasmic adaptor subunit [Balneolaceae bacterium]
MNITKTQILTYTTILLAGIILGWLIFGGTHDHDDHAGHDHASAESADEVWTCSMHPSVREDGPGSCPICGMDLIPAASHEREDDFSMVMTEASIRLANIQTAPVIRDLPKKEITLPGRIAVDERRISYVTAHFEGRIHDVKIDFTGAPIRKGEVMATIYSQEVVSAQRELLEAHRNRERSPGMYDSAVRKFKLWEFTDEQIQQIIDRGEVQTHMEILSPVDGYVMVRNVVDDQHVMEGSVIYEVANLDHLWVTLEAYEEDIEWISTGDSIEFKTRSNPGRTYEAIVDYIDPTFNPEKRTIRLRADISNSDNRLRPDMLVTGVLSAEQSEEKLMVPVSSVLWTGPRSLVYVKDTDAETPRFMVREVDLGPRSGDYYVIEGGVEEDEEVVFNGAFRVDSEFQLADRFSMMNREPGTGAVPAGHDHGTMDHDDHADEMDIEPFDDVPEDFRSKLTAAIEAYITGKDALVESDLSGAQSGFNAFIDKLNEIGEHGLSGDGHMAWMESWSALMEHAEGITAADDIEEARTHFRHLSDDLIKAVQLFGIEGVVYHQYCPMAFDDEGAYWLSSEEQIQNPYLPETMLGCGEVIESIE